MIKVLSFSKGVLIIDIDGEIVELSNAVNECITSIEYLPGEWEDDAGQLIIQTNFRVDILALPDNLKFRIEEIEEQIKIAE